jgi:SAM-dependent methyltransferase
MALSAEQFRRRGERFAARSVAENYVFRPPYSSELYATLLGLIRDRPRTILDAGCGTGKIARGLINDCDRVDAVDPSMEMIRVGRTLPGGDSPKIRWLRGSIETVKLSPPYALAVAATSFHWMNPDVALKRFGEVLSARGVLAVLSGDSPVDTPWEPAEAALTIAVTSKADGVSPAERATELKTAAERLAAPLVNHPRFAIEGTRITAPASFSQSIADYLRCLHSRQSLSVDHIGAEISRELDAALTRVLSRYAVNGMLTFGVRTRIEWGRPLSGQRVSTPARS